MKREPRTKQWKKNNIEDKNNRNQHEPILYVIMFILFVST